MTGLVAERGENAVLSRGEGRIFAFERCEAFHAGRLGTRLSHSPRPPYPQNRTQSRSTRGISGEAPEGVDYVPAQGSERLAHGRRDGLVVRALHWGLVNGTPSSKDSSAVRIPEGPTGSQKGPFPLQRLEPTDIHAETIVARYFPSPASCGDNSTTETGIQIIRQNPDQILLQGLCPVMELAQSETIGPDTGHDLRPIQVLRH